ncbi:MAG: helix-hairpin-helix domain-containing protein [Pirellulales bacterium]|nr:helix-hairpin-helix domain-containing protein [Pirellulales bacterium]
MTPPSADKPTPDPHWLLRRADQLGVALLVLAGLGGSIGWWFAQGGWQGRLVEFERAAPCQARFQVDLNAASWPELAQLPGLGETLARRIVASREEDGAFLDHDDLLRVRGIGPRKLDAVRPFLLPMPSAENVAGR